MKWKLKAFIQFIFNRIPFGPVLYRYITIKLLNTRYGEPWKWCKWFRDHTGIIKKYTGKDIAHCSIWVLDAGPTITAGYLVNAFAKNGILSNYRFKMYSQYNAKAEGDVLEMLDTLQQKNTLLRANFTEIEGNIQIIENSHPKEIPLKDNSIDICMSQGTFEHYKPDDLKQILNKCYAVLKKDGLMSHNIVHSNHYSFFNPEIGHFSHLQYSNFWWNCIAGGELTYHNRLTRSKCLKLFEDAGFTILYAKYASHNNMVPIPPKIHKDFRNLPREDFEASVTQLLAVKH